MLIIRSKSLVSQPCISIDYTQTLIKRGIGRAMGGVDFLSNCSTFGIPNLLESGEYVNICVHTGEYIGYLKQILLYSYFHRISLNIYSFPIFLLH